MRAFIFILPLALLLAVKPALASDVDDLKEEQKAMKAYPGVTKRQGKTLTLKLLNGQVVKLTDEEILDANGMVHTMHDPDLGLERGAAIFRFAGRVPQADFLLVNLYHWEDETVMLIDERTGRRFLLEGKPFFSPDGEKLVSLRCNEMSGFSGAQLWQVMGELGPQARYLEEHERHAQICYKTVEWRGNAKIFVTGEFVDYTKSQNGQDPRIKRTDSFTYNEQFREWVFTHGKPELAPPAK